MPKKINIRAVYRDGSLTPLGPVDIEDGDVVSLTIEVEDKLSKEERIKRMKSAAGAWKGKHDPEELKRMLHGPKLSTNGGLKRYASAKRNTERGLRQMKSLKCATRTASNHPLSPANKALIRWANAIQ